MKWKVIAISFFVSIALVGCSGDNTKEESSPKPNEAQTQNIKDLVHDYSVGNVENVSSASITSELLIVKDNKGNETVYDLPNDEFFVSIAPYLEQTHP